MRERIGQSLDRLPIGKVGVGLIAAGYILDASTQNDAYTALIAVGSGFAAARLYGSSQGRRILSTRERSLANLELWHAHLVKLDDGGRALFWGLNGEEYRSISEIEDIARVRIQEAQNHVALESGQPLSPEDAKENERYLQQMKKVADKKLRYLEENGLATKTYALVKEELPDGAYTYNQREAFKLTPDGEDLTSKWFSITRIRGMLTPLEYSEPEE